MTVRLFSLLLATLLITPVSAGEFDFILGDIDNFQKFLEWQIQAEVQAMEDNPFQQSEELFYELNERTDTDTAIRKAEGNVTLRIDGIPVIFEDVPSDSWFGPYVRGAAQANIVTGYRDANGRLIGMFGPGDNVTVEQLAKMALQAAGISLGECAGVPKNRTAVDSWSAEYIACAEQLGWAVFSDASVDVFRSATRAEVVVTIVQSFAIEFSRGTGGIFDDVTASTEFSGAIEMSASAGVVEGYKDNAGQLTGLFGPGDAVNRAEVAKIMVLASQIYGN
jgi:hypothetical protein